MSGPASASSSATPQFSHVVLVVEENHSYSSVIGNPSLPYLNSLAGKYGLATQYFANTHPSIGNYMMLTAGDLLTNDDATSQTFNADNIAQEVSAAGKSWKAYMDGLPGPGYLGPSTGSYARNHDPFSYFASVRNHQAGNIVPFSRFSSDVASGNLPNFAFISPSRIHDGHDCPDGSPGNCTDTDKLAALDSWLRGNLAPLLSSSAFQQGGLLVITFDEGDAADTAQGGGHVATIVVSSKAKPGYQSSTMFQHQSTLRLACDALRLGACPGSGAGAPSMAGFFQ